MNYPDIKSYHENRRQHFISSIYDRPKFLGRDALDVRWQSNDFPVNIKKKDDLYEMEVVIPGFAKEELDITVADDILTIRAIKKKETTEEEASKYLLKEFEVRVVERKFQLAKGIGHEKIKADYNEGILKLTFIDVPENEEKWYKTIEVS